jgi:hypothetical protein
VRVFAIDGSEKSLDWLVQTWGVQVDTSLRKAGRNFVVTRIWEREGAAIYPVRVLNIQGLPWEGCIVGRSWPGAPNGWPGGCKPDNVVAPPEAINRAVFGVTNANGMVEFGLGKGDYAAPGQGVSIIWCPSHIAGSDVVRKLGMLPNTNHRTLGIEFQLVEAGSQEPRGCLTVLLNLLRGS